MPTDLSVLTVVLRVSRLDNHSALGQSAFTRGCAGTLHVVDSPVRVE